jgi:hypothetical protein
MTTGHLRLAKAGALLRGSGELHVVGSDEVVTIADPDGVMQRLLSLADGSRSRAELAGVLMDEFERLDAPDAERAIDELEWIGLLARRSYLP